MQTDFLPYSPTGSFRHVNQLLANHYRFTIDALPDLSFWITSVNLPSVSSSDIKRPNPFTSIREPGDHLDYGTLNIGYLVDAEFQTYRSLYWWLQGYGCPRSFEEYAAFAQARQATLRQPHASYRNVVKTQASLDILEPDTDRIVITVRFTDVFPTSLGELSFSTDTDATTIRSNASFSFTEFSLHAPAVA